MVLSEKGASVTAASIAFILLRRPTMDLSFEFVETNEIVTSANRKISVFEYEQLYVSERGDAKRAGITLIPPPFFRFLSQTGNNVNETKFSLKSWEFECAPRLTAKINHSLMPFQREAVYKMYKARRCINAADCGLGKSVQGLAALLCCRNSLKGDLILCPGSLRANWMAEVKKWLGEDYPVQIINKGGKAHIEASTKAMLFGPGIKIVSYDMAATFFKALSTSARSRAYFNTVLCDESHQLKEPSTKRFQYLAPVIKASWSVFLLTGTPAPNRNAELWSQFSLVNNVAFRDRRLYTDRYCNGHLDKFNRYDCRGASCMKELAYMTRKLVIRMRREDHLDEIPAVTRQKVILSPETMPSAFNKKMVQFRKTAQDADSDKYATQRLQALASEMFRETALIKQKPVLEYLDTFCQPDREKTVLFCIHHTMLDAVSGFLTDKKNVDFIVISGKTPMKERTALIEKFLTDPAVTYALCTLGSCSTGLNFTPVAAMVFLELSWDLCSMLQAQCRINRIGGATHLSYTYLLCDNTLDESVFRKIKNKNKNTIQVLEGGKDYGDLHFDQKDDTSFKRRKCS
jgi:SWI/SNF-related matrix-associated actin-dependent regulator 1 of chromatin subfamily A